MKRVKKKNGFKKPINPPQMPVDIYFSFLKLIEIVIDESQCDGSEKGLQVGLGEGIRCHKNLARRLLHCPDKIIYRSTRY